MPAKDSFSLRFLGVRGTVATPGMMHARYGGNTSCVEVRCGAQVLLLDAGTGCLAFAHGNHAIRADILLSHTHIDHILGLPLLLPACGDKSEIGIWAGHLKPETGVRDAIGKVMSNPLFPITLDDMKAQVRWHDFTAGQQLHNPAWEQAGISVSTFALAHPDRATGYRIDYQGHSICYITDYEHAGETPDAALVAFVKGADALIYDSTYTDENYVAHKGWGHSTWQQGLRLADAAGVKRLIPFHHDPDADDATLDTRNAALKSLRPDSFFAQEQMRLELWPQEGVHVPEYSTAQDAVQLVEQLTSIGTALSAENDLDLLLEIILQEAQKIAHADGGTLYYRNGDMLEFSIIRNDTLKLAFGGKSGARAPFAPLPLYDAQSPHASQRTLAAYAVQQKASVNIDDAYDTKDFDFEGAKIFDRQHGYRTTSVLAIPMMTHSKEVLGCLQLINARHPKTGEVIAFSPQVQQLVQSLASQAAIILHNKTLLKEQKDLLEAFIKMIAQAIDAKSPYTGAHCERVPTLTNMLAKAACDAKDGAFGDFTLTPEEVYELHIAGWLHDCGKVTTPVHIMDKSTKLETIFDRIALIETRFELLKREAQIAMLEQSALPGADAAALKAAYEAKAQKIDDDLAFIRKSNVGGEFMSDADLERLRGIAAQPWGDGRTALTGEELYNLSTRRGTLTQEERTIMNDHMVHTCAMLEALPFPKHLARVPEYAGGHHERMDGKGYPKGIRAGDMSIPARMMAVADVFEALTADDRPYKSAKKLSEAMGIIGQMKKQHHLDPVVVDFFITSGVYMDYARRFLRDELIDAVDEAALLAIRPVTS